MSFVKTTDCDSISASLSLTCVVSVGSRRCPSWLRCLQPLLDLAIDLTFSGGRYRVPWRSKDNLTLPVSTVMQIVSVADVKLCGTRIHDKDQTGQDTTHMECAFNRFCLYVPSAQT